MYDTSSDTGVSPVVGVILMVAVTVILSATVGMFVFNLGQQAANDPGASNVGVTIDENSDGTVTVQLTDLGGADRVIIQTALGYETNLTSAGESAVVTTNGEPVTVMAQTNGERTVVQTYDEESSVSRTGVVDSMEDNDLVEYEGGDNATLTTGPVADGTYALKAVRSTSGSLDIGYSSNGLTRYPDAGDTFEFRMNTSTHNQAKFGFGTQPDGPGTYTVAVRKAWSNSKFRLAMVHENSTFEVVTQKSVSIPTREWLRIQVEWRKSGNITATIWDASGTQIAQISMTDTSYKSGGIGFGGYDDSGGYPVYYDNVTITESR